MMASGIAKGNGIPNVLGYRLVFVMVCVGLAFSCKTFHVQHHSDMLARLLSPTVYKLCQSRHL